MTGEARGEGRPPWWPEEEPFPPAGWRRARRHPMRRMVLFPLIAFTVMSLVVAFFVTLFIQLFGGQDRAGFWPFAVLLTVLLFLAIARGTARLARPLGALIDAAERVEAGDYRTRVEPHGPRELRALARAFNAMSSRLERSETERRRLLADVTHELRTPLTVMRGNVEALIDGVYPADRAHLERILDETNVLSRLVDDLRTLSLAESGALALHREPTRVGALVRETVAAFGPQAAAARVTVGVEANDAEADVDPVRVREIVGNVLANALRYARARVSVVVDGADPVRITVRDDGPGIDADLLPHVFERFARSDTSPGAGLGLAIAKGLVAAHGGAIEARSAAGQGTEIAITFPRAP